MTKEDKELLLKDLCARLPYRVKVLCLRDFNHDWYKLEMVDIADNEVYVTTYESYAKRYVKIEEVKPYLFPLSSMTEEQKQYLKNRFCYDWDGEPYELWKYQIEIGDADELIDWFHKNHFDYRNLIEKGLAIDATNLNIY